MSEVDLNGPEVHLDESDEQELLAASEDGDELEIHTEDYFADETASEVFEVDGPLKTMKGGKMKIHLKPA